MNGTRTEVFVWISYKCYMIENVFIFFFEKKKGCLMLFSLGLQQSVSPLVYNLQKTKQRVGFSGKKNSVSKVDEYCRENEACRN